MQWQNPPPPTIPTSYNFARLLREILSILDADDDNPNAVHLAHWRYRTTRALGWFERWNYRGRLH
jgi:hypothetical protein